MTPEESVRLLRAKAAELEADPRATDLAVDIALIAALLADHIERTEATLTLYVVHTENLIERVYALEQGQQTQTRGDGCVCGHDFDEHSLFGHCLVERCPCIHWPTGESPGERQPR